MKLRATTLEYELEDESGYRFHVVATKDDDLGWAATVTLSASGYLTPEAAIEHVGLSAADFLRQLKATSSA